MNKDYPIRLKEFSEANRNTYQQVLNDCQNDIIDALGGIDTMIELCLTNPQFSTNKYISQFESFQRLMESKNINIENDMYIHDTTMGDHDDDKDEHGVILTNAKEFDKYSLNIVAHHGASIYFMILPRTVASYIFNDILYTKMYPVCCVVSFGTLLITSQIYLYFFDYDAIFFSLVIAGYIVGIVASLSYILSANISIVKLIIETFDFWYKVYNLIVWIITTYFIYFNVNGNTGYYIISSLSAILGFSFAFTLDSICVEMKYKNLYVIVLVLWGMYAAFYAYFFIDDTSENIYWNPFKEYDFQYSRINFKSVFISSQINLCLFMLKPIGNQINRKIQKCIGKKKNFKNDVLLVQRSCVIYKRPYIHWIRDLQL